jgi:hypothetical protein
MGRTYAKDGSRPDGFSDYDCCDFRYGAVPDWFVLRGPFRANILNTPARYERQIYLPPGEYDLRVVLSDGENFGRAEVPISVKGRGIRGLALSDIALSKRFREASAKSQDDSAKPAGSYVPLVSKGVEVTPTADTRFHKGDIFYFYFEVYEPPHTEWPKPIVEANLRIVDAKTGAIVKASEPLDAASYVIPGNPIIPIGAGTDISKLPLGSYRLEIQATASTGQSTPWRSASFTIE